MVTCNWCMYACLPMICLHAHELDQTYNCWNTHFNSIFNDDSIMTEQATFRLWRTYDLDCHVSPLRRHYIPLHVKSFTQAIPLQQLSEGKYYRVPNAAQFYTSLPDILVVSDSLINKKYHLRVMFTLLQYRW